LTLQDDLFLPYVLDLASHAQLERWLPGLATGQLIGALAMTEPGAGSDLRGIRTTATPTNNGWVLSGQKTFISSGSSADLIVVAARTPSDRLSLFMVERDMPGFVRGKKIKKLGMHAQDTSELFFDNVVLDPGQLLGREGDGMLQLRSHLARERLATTVFAVTSARAILDATMSYVEGRQAFGRRVADFQNTRFVMAELATEVEIAEHFADEQVRAYMHGTFTPTDAAKGKWWATELEKRVVDRCLQFHGGYGYMLEYPVARAFLDSRVQTIYGGTTEIMKEIIARDLFPHPAAS